MSTKGRNQFSHHHPNTPQRLPVVRERERLKGELHAQRTGAHTTEAPHFPPSENLPPQAKRLLEKKKRRKAEPSHAGEDAARAHGAGMQATAAQDDAPRTAGQVRPEDYPDALPRREDEAREAQSLLGRAQPVIRDAQSHWTGVRESAGRLWSESLNLLRTPGVLMRALLRPQKA